MSVRIRLRRVGSKKNPIWRVVVADQRSPRDGRTIETIGQYNPQPDPSLIVIDEDRAKHWLEKGARPTKTVATLLRTKGIESTGSWRGMRELLEFLARSLVSDPNAVEVTEVEEIDGEVVLELEVADDDLGRVIGRGGRVANALRSVMKAAATREEKRVVVDILD
jgi:small subunit ribosomal protein S16